MLNKKAGTALAAAASLFFLSTCGMEDYFYLPRIPTGNISVTGDSAVVRLPDYSGAFTGFTIYYRIYISGANVTGTISEVQHSSISPSLATDYRSIYPSTATDSASGSSISSLFSGRRYYTLFLEGANITEILGNGSGSGFDSGNGNTSFNLDFSVGQPPTLSLTDTAGTLISGPHTLIRSNNGGAFSPLPINRYFLNTGELNDNANAISTINDDTAQNSAAGSPRYTYVSMYITAVGFDETNFSPLYSNPTFIGIFRLSDG